METAAKVLVVGGVANLAFGFIIGVFLAGARMRAPQAPRPLVLAHLGPIMGGPALLGLTLALPLSTLSTRTETVAAWLLAGGSAALALGESLNWLQRVGDPFAERSAGWRMAGLSAIASSAGLAILGVGVIKGL